MLGITSCLIGGALVGFWGSGVIFFEKSGKIAGVRYFEDA